jgi:signal transduction histidine kinase
MNALPRSSLDKQHVETLRRWRWLILVAGLVAVFTIEILEHGSFADPDFWRELLLYGLGFPAVVWLVLTMLARQAERRSEVEAKSAWLQELNWKLEERPEWTELTRFVAGFPATFLPVEHVSLFVYDHARAQLRFVTEWNASGLNSSPLCRYRVDAALCRSCSASKPSATHPLVQCGFFTAAQPPADVKEYCQPMLYNGLLVAVEVLRCWPGQDLDDEQRGQLQVSAASSALALALSIVRRAQMDQTREQAEIDERQRVAAELHDSLGQTISYVHLTLDRLANDDRLQPFGDIQRDLLRMLRVTDNAYDQIRSDLWVLRAWQTPDMMEAIARYIETIRNNSGLDIQLKTEGLPVYLEPKVSYQIFTLVREGLTNIVTHAQAQRACIELVWKADQLRLQLIDDGIGFDPALAPQPGHYGLRMLSERVLALNGVMLIDSSPGRGACLSFTLPLAPPASPAAVTTSAAEQQPM